MVAHARSGSWDILNSHKIPASFDGTSSFKDYLVQFNMVGDFSRWDTDTKTLESATSLRVTAHTVLRDSLPRNGEIISNVCVRSPLDLYEPIKPRYTVPRRKTDFVRDLEACRNLQRILSGL